MTPLNSLRKLEIRARLHLFNLILLTYPSITKILIALTKLENM